MLSPKSHERNDYAIALFSTWDSHWDAGDIGNVGASITHIDMSHGHGDMERGGPATTETTCSNQPTNPMLPRELQIYCYLRYLPKAKTQKMKNKHIAPQGYFSISHTYCMTYKAAYLARVGTVRALRLKFVFGLSQSAVAHPGCQLLLVSSRSFLRPTEIKLLVIHSFAFPKRKCWWLWRWWLSDAQCRTWCWSRTQTCNLRT